MSFKETTKLNDGNTIPLIGLGTWLSKPNQVKEAVEIAIRAGYTHIDCAKIYGNHSEVGEAFKKTIPSVIKREDLFVTSKLWNSAHKPEQVEAALDDTLQELGLDYLDLYLIHWPVPLDSSEPNKTLMPDDGSGYAVLDRKTTLVDTWNAMIALQKTGKVKSIGVSNFTQSMIEGIIKATGVTPAVNQIEAHPLLPQEDLVKFSNEKGIHITAYSPLGNASGYGEDAKTKDILGSKQVQEVAKKLGAEAGQVLIAWGRRRGYSVIPKSVTKSRIESNFQQIKLSDEDYKKVSEFILEHGGHFRFNIPVNYKPIWDINVFHEDIELKAKHQVNIGN